MKRLLFISLTACLFSLSSFAAETNYPDALKSFYKTFQNAKDVSWTEVNDMLRIDFTLNGHQQFAYYSNEELVVVATKIKAEELPANLKTQLVGYKGYVVKEVYEMNKDNVKEYCVVIDSSSRHIVLKGKNKWQTFLEERN